MRFVVGLLIGATLGAFLLGGETAVAELSAAVGLTPLWDYVTSSINQL